MLHRAIASGAEHRREYRGSKAFDASCRNHRGCPYCEGSRLRYLRRDRDVARAELADAQEGCDR